MKQIHRIFQRNESNIEHEKKKSIYVIQIIVCHKQPEKKNGEN